jgi:streptogrisin C
VRGTRHTKVDRTFHNNIAVGLETTAAGMAGTVYPTDYAAIPYVSTATAGYWMPRNRNEVSSLCVAGWSTAQCRGGAIAIKGVTRYEDMRSGFVVCHTGSAEPDYGGAGWKPGTRCGVINGWTGAGIRTNTCGRPGDSGAPLFSEVSGTAYGILYGGSTVRGACRVGAEFSTFSPISKIYTKLPAHIRLAVRPL